MPTLDRLGRTVPAAIPREGKAGAQRPSGARDTEALYSQEGGEIPHF